MRIARLYLEGYIGIFNGLGLEKIEIDLSRAKHKICLIAGPNGVGKSTIIGALHLLPDSNTSFISNRTARKELDIIGDDVNDPIYRIIINSNCANGKRTNEAYISKNGIELNPNGNITSYKEVAFAEFDIDANFIAMSRISSEDRGLADKTPAERKKMIASRIESLDVYNEMYKSLNKKANIFKSHLNSISSKLQNLGNREELELRLIEIGKSEYAVTVNIEDNKRSMIEAETQMKLLDPSGDLGAQYAENVLKLSTVNSEIEAISIYIEDVEHEISNNTYRSFKNGSEVKEKLIEAEKQIASLQGEKNQIITSLNDIENKLESLGYALEAAMNSDIDSGTYYTSLKARGDKQRELRELESSFKATGNPFIMVFKSEALDPKSINRMVKVTEDLSFIDFTSIGETLDEKITDLIRSEIGSFGSIAALIGHFSISKTEMEEYVEKLSREVIELEEDISHTSDRLTEYEAELESVKIPAKCNSLGSGKCSLLDNFRSIKEKVDDLRRHYCVSRDSLDTMKSALIENEDKLNTFEGAIKKLMLLDSVLKYISLYEDIISILYTDITMSSLTDDLLLRSSIEIQQMINTIVDSKEHLLELYNVSVEKEVLISGIYAIDKAIEKHKDIANNISKFEADIKIFEADKQKIKSRLDDINYRLETTEVMKADYERISVYYDKLDDARIKYEKAKAEYDQLAEKAKEMDAAGKKVIELQELVKKHQNIINTAMERLKEVSDEKKRIESQLLIWDNFQQEYQQYNEKYNYVNILRKYSSPTQGGIQSLYMSLYMSKTLDVSNQILSMLFNGQYRILDYIINENEFRIPFIGAGMMVDDISSGSTSQKCIMGSIISLVSNSSTSPVYNIALLDEVDSGLDQDNRMLFANTILEASDILHISQLFSISHSIEASINNVDVILLSNKQSYLDRFANSNIIYQYEGGM